MRAPRHTLGLLQSLGVALMTDFPWSPAQPRITPLLLLPLAGVIAGLLTGYVLYQGCAERYWTHGDGFLWDSLEHFGIIGLAVGTSAGTALALSRNLLVRLTLSGGFGILAVTLAVSLYSEGRPIYIWGSSRAETDNLLFQRPLGWGLYFGGPSAAALALSSAIIRRCRAKIKLQVLMLLVGVFVAIRAQNYFWDTWNELRLERCNAPCHSSCPHIPIVPVWINGLLLILCSSSLQLWMDLFSRLACYWKRPALTPITVGTMGGLLLAGVAWADNSMAWTPPSRINVLRFTEEPDRFVTVHDGESLREWRILNPDPGQPPNVELVRTRRLRHGPIRLTSFSLNSSLAVAGSQDGFVAIWDSESLKSLGTFKATEQWIGQIRISPDGRFLAFGNRRSPIHLWKLDPGASGLEGQPHFDLDPDRAGDVNEYAFSPKGHRIAVTTGTGALTVHDLDSGKQTLERECYKRPFDDPPLFSEDGLFLAYRTRSGLHVIEDLRRRQRLEIHGRPLSIASTPGIVAISTGNTIQFVEIGSGKVLRTQASSNYYAKGAFSPDGRWFVTDDENGDFEAIDCLRLFKEPNSRIRESVRLDPAHDPRGPVSSSSSRH